MPFQIRETCYGECPKCRFSLEPLRASVVLIAEEGYMLDSRGYTDRDDNIFTSILFGMWERYVYRYFVEPIYSRTIGNIKKSRYRRILAQYPKSLICTHCRYVLRR